jgi:5'-3' exonuclease
MDRITLIDGFNQMWRATTTFGPPITHEICCNSSCNHKFLSTNTIHCACGARWKSDDNDCYGNKYGFIFNFFRNLRPLIEQCSPDKCFFVLEGHPQFRYDLFSDYKANRIIKTASKQEVHDKFNLARDEIIRLIQYLPITIAKADKYEADDTISSLSENMKDEDITIISNDSDYIQLLQKGYSNISIYNPIKKELMEAPKYSYLIWKILAGDKADNIPSLLKPKKALDTVNSPELFRKFLSIEENRANFSINKSLIEFRQVPTEEIILTDCKANFTALRKEFVRMDFQSIINDNSWEKYIETFNCVKY